MPIILRNSRLSLVAGQCFFEQAWRAERGPDPVPWRYSYYVRTFNQIRGGLVVPDFAFPWRPSQRSAFWSLYLGGQPLAGVSARSAWDAMTPFRLTNLDQPKVGTDNTSERVFYDVYGYPHGVVAAITIQGPGKSVETLEEWRDRTRRLRLDRPFSVTDGAATRAGLNAAEALDALLDWHRHEYYGEITERYQSADPISIGAVIQGDGVDPAAPIGEDIHRALYAVTSWPRDWQNAPLPKLDDQHCLKVKDRNRSTGDALYAAGRGRTLWRPGLFSPQNDGGASKPLNTLSCLAHNLLAGAIQAESLRLFAQGFDASPAQKQIDTDLVNAAAGLLDRMRRGVETYRSSSIQRLIEDPNSKAEVNALLARGKGKVGEALAQIA